MFNNKKINEILESLNRHANYLQSLERKIGELESENRLLKDYLKIQKVTRESRDGFWTSIVTSFEKIKTNKK